MRLVATLLALMLLPQAQPSSLRPRVRGYVDAHQKEIVGELLELLTIPNVAADKANIRRNAEYLQRMFVKHHFTAEILETDGNPLVFAEVQGPQNPNLPTILYYCHYDGHPADVSLPPPLCGGARRSEEVEPAEPVRAGRSW